MSEVEVSEHELQALYTWVDEIPLSRPKRNIARDFSDGVLMAEIVHHYFPKLVELHNYSSANGLQQKMYNWNTLNQKVFKRMGFLLPKQDCEAICNCQPGAIERMLKLIKAKLAKYREEGFTGTIPAAPAPTKAQHHIPPAQPTYQDTYSGEQDVSVMKKINARQPVIHVTAGAVLNSAPQSYNAQKVPGILPEVLVEKDQAISELRETNEILETKVRKLEQLVRLKDAKIQTLMAKLQAAGMA